MRMLRCALRHLADDWAIFPIKPRGKEPLTRNGCKDATRSLAQVTEWWVRWPEANIGLATGERYWVIDIDGEAGEQSWMDLASQQPSQTWATRSVRTPGGGWHMIYTVPSGARLPSSVSRLARSVDTRGAGGYIVGAGSVHPNGGVYETACDMQPLTAPRWVLRIIDDWSKPRFTPPVVQRDGSLAIDDPADRKLEELRASVNGTRNDTLNTVAYWFASNGRADARDEIEAAALACGLGQFETRRTIDSAFRAALGGPRIVVPQYAIGA